MPELLELPDPRGRDRALESADRVRRPASAATTKEADAASDCALPLLLFDRVSKWYGPVIGLNQVTLELRGGITGLVGANGAGKSTLMRLATGQLRPDLGSVQVRGRDAWDWRAKALVGYCPDADAFYEDLSGREFVAAMARLCGFDRREANRRTEAV